MTSENLLKLLVLALVDSTSIGTLVIPVWLLLRRDVGRIAGRIGIYLVTIGVFYFLIGVLMLTSATTVLQVWGDGARMFIDSRPAHWVALAGGAGLLWFALKDGKTVRRTAKPQHATTATGATATAPDQPGPSGPQGRQEAAEERWKTRIGRALGTPAGLLTLALVAGLLELPTMLPYVAAIGVLTVSGPAGAGSFLLLAGYCVVMLLPAGLLLTARLLLAHRINGPLHRLGQWLGKASAEAVLWIMGVGGFLLLRFAVGGL
ncbi:MAG: GAP family protein [Arthrobacter sp.]|uniref:GAP family protein n=1 Tax=unclassified Arthrobacter TaxID=235627 RepID=UPI00264A8915|nr:GAP family protein [Micrococcaceae bacterium]MDN5812550.1 GAP family protein [Micrococcaceae bacterium]MDN5878082.1 GAP family protein [Micrococcaceae bacterium]MDN5886836.1 GAP family protein [Micrococcaceae bacterium]MDN5904713.1 GAP family protein [Micrococcaceae bacterium]